MEVIVLSGKSNSGKTTILDNFYKKLKDDDFEEKMSHYTYDRKDHRVFLNGKDSDGNDINVVITSPGDNCRELFINYLFVIDCCFYNNKELLKKDYWILSENTKYNNVKKSFEILCEKIKNHQFKNIINYSKVTTNKKERKDKSGQKDDNKQCLDEILEKLNIKEVNDEVL